MASKRRPWRPKNRVDGRRQTARWRWRWQPRFQWRKRSLAGTINSSASSLLAPQTVTAEYKNVKHFLLPHPPARAKVVFLELSTKQSTSSFLTHGLLILLQDQTSLPFPESGWWFGQMMVFLLLLVTYVFNLVLQKVGHRRVPCFF